MSDICGVDNPQQRTVIARNEHGHWKPGQSANPGGRAPIIREVRDLARQYTVEAIEGLLKIGRTSKSDAAQVAAWTEILNRGWGKAPAKNDDDSDAFEHFSPEARALINSVCDLLLDKFRSERAQVIDATPTDTQPTDKR